jgi:hypothetical protein
MAHSFLKELLRSNKTVDSFKELSLLWPSIETLSGIGELLNEKQKVWVKASLLTDAIFLLKLALSGE